MRTVHGECVCKTILAKKATVWSGFHETRGRKGKGVTLIAGIPADEAGLKELGKELKARRWPGGAVLDSMMEIQGDNRNVLPTFGGYID